MLSLVGSAIANSYWSQRDRFLPSPFHGHTWYSYCSLTNSIDKYKVCKSCWRAQRLAQRCSLNTYGIIKESKSAQIYYTEKITHCIVLMNKFILRNCHFKIGKESIFSIVMIVNIKSKFFGQCQNSCLISE